MTNQQTRILFRQLKTVYDGLAYMPDERLTPEALEAKLQLQRIIGELYLQFEGDQW